MNGLFSKDDFEQSKWLDWRWQMANSLRSVEDLAKWVNLADEEILALKETSQKYKWRITPYYASLMDKNNSNCPIRLQAIPNNKEMKEYVDAEVDPVGDTKYRKTNRVIHKYPDRAVFLVTQTCPVYCRHCTRKFHTTEKEGTYFEHGEGSSWEEDFGYIEKHPEINDVLLTGGDPLTYADHKIEPILKRLRSIPHVGIIRIGSRYPVVLPQRITDDFCRMVEKYHPVWFSTHFNHSKELSNDALEACDRLLRHGLPVQNQSVLLKGINDNIDDMRALLKGLLKARVKPYYLYQCDNANGVSHFMTSVAKGREIMDGLVGHISGYALPRYIITTDLGKISLERTYVNEDGAGARIENYKGEVMNLPFGIDKVPSEK